MNPRGQCVIPTPNSGSQKLDGNGFLFGCFFHLKLNSAHSQWAVMKQMVNDKAWIKKQFVNIRLIFHFVFCVPKKCQSRHYLSMRNSLRQTPDTNKKALILKIWLATSKYIILMFPWTFYHHQSFPLHATNVYSPWHCSPFVAFKRRSHWYLQGPDHYVSSSAISAVSWDYSSWGTVSFNLFCTAFQKKSMWKIVLYSGQKIKT